MKPSKEIVSRVVNRMIANGSPVIVEQKSVNAETKAQLDAVRNCVVEVIAVTYSNTRAIYLKGVLLCWLDSAGWTVNSESGSVHFSTDDVQSVVTQPNGSRVIRLKDWA